MDTSLLADLIGSNSVNFLVSFHWNDLGAICVNGMITAFPEQMKAVVRQVPNEVTPFD